MQVRVAMETGTFHFDQTSLLQNVDVLLIFVKYQSCLAASLRPSLSVTHDVFVSLQQQVFWNLTWFSVLFDSEV